MPARRIGGGHQARLGDARWRFGDCLGTGSKALRLGTSLFTAIALVRSSQSLSACSRAAASAKNQRQDSGLIAARQAGAAAASGLANCRASRRCGRPIPLPLDNSRHRSRCLSNLRPMVRDQPVPLRERRREMGIRTRREPEARRRHIAGYEGRYRPSQSGRLEAPAGPTRPSRATCLLVHLMRRLFKRRF